MRALRGYINGVNIKSIKCVVDQCELNEQEENEMVRNGESLIAPWVKIEVKCTFGLRDKKLYEYALSLLRNYVIFRVEGNEVVSIEPISIAASCHFCNARRFMDDFLGNALCTNAFNRPSGMTPFCGRVRGINAPDLGKLLTVKIPNMAKRADGTMYAIGAKEYTYYGHVMPICKNCAKDKPEMRVEELLQELSKHNHVLDIDGTRIKT